MDEFEVSEPSADENKLKLNVEIKTFFKQKILKNSNSAKTPNSSENVGNSLDEHSSSTQSLKRNKILSHVVDSEPIFNSMESSLDLSIEIPSENLFFLQRRLLEQQTSCDKNSMTSLTQNSSELSAETSSILGDLDSFTDSHPSLHSFHPPAENGVKVKSKSKPDLSPLDFEFDTLNERDSLTPMDGNSALSSPRFVGLPSLPLPDLLALPSSPRPADLEAPVVPDDHSTSSTESSSEFLECSLTESEEHPAQTTSEALDAPLEAVDALLIPDIPSPEVLEVLKEPATHAPIEPIPLDCGTIHLDGIQDEQSDTSLEKDQKEEISNSSTSAVEDNQNQVDSIPVSERKEEEERVERKLLANGSSIHESHEESSIIDSCVEIDSESEAKMESLSISMDSEQYTQSNTQIQSTDSSVDMGEGVTHSRSGSSISHETKEHSETILDKDAMKGSLVNKSKSPNTMLKKKRSDLSEVERMLNIGKASVRLGGGGEVCFGCKRTVYPLEKIIALDRAWHRPCFCCTSCGVTLLPHSKFQIDNKPYCKHHFNSARVL